MVGNCLQVFRIFCNLWPQMTLKYWRDIEILALYTGDEIVQNQTARFFLGVHRFAPTEGLQGDLGWFSCRMRRKMNVLRYWNRLLKLDDDRLTKHFFLWDYGIIKNNWSSHVGEILSDISCIERFQNLEPGRSSEMTCNAQSYKDNCWKK